MKILWVYSQEPGAKTPRCPGHPCWPGSSFRPRPPSPRDGRALNPGGCQGLLIVRGIWWAGWAHARHPVPTPALVPWTCWRVVSSCSWPCLGSHPLLAASWRCPRRRVRRCVRGAGDGAAGRDGPDAPNGPTIRRAAPPSGGHRLGVGGAGREWKCTVPSLVHFGMPHCGQGQEDRQRWEESVVNGAPEAPWSSHPPNRCW